MKRSVEPIPDTERESSDGGVIAEWGKLLMTTVTPLRGSGLPQTIIVLHVTPCRES